MPTTVVSSIGRLRRIAARRLRAAQTPAERRLWRRLREFPASGTHFRRQVPIGPYIADFACLAKRLVIELDGSQHYLMKGIIHDEARTRWFQAEGYRVIRFSNVDVSENIEGVLEAIYVEIFGSRHSLPGDIKHHRLRRLTAPNVVHPTPARTFGARRPSPSRGG